MHSEFSVARSVLESYFDAFKAFPDAPRTIFAKHGVVRLGPNGEIEIPASAPLDKLIAAMNELMALVSPQKAFEIGLQFPNRVATVPGVKDIVTAMQIFNAGYHLNHLKDGVVMYDPETGTMIEGIGGYRCVAVSKHRVVMEVDAPYYCDLDRGIIQAWARRFERSALVTHLEPSVCRKNRSPRCRYEVSWK